MESEESCFTESDDIKHKEFSSSSDPKCAYLLAEVTIFNNRVIWYLEQQQKQEIFALGASGVLWAYLLKGEGNMFTYMVAMVPPVITAALYAKSLVMTKAMGESMAYLEKLEDSFKLSNDLGWVHYYKSNTSNYKKRWRNYFWKGLLTINLLICFTMISYLVYFDKQRLDKASLPCVTEYKDERELNSVEKKVDVKD